MSHSDLRAASRCAISARLKQAYIQRISHSVKKVKLALAAKAGGGAGGATAAAAAAKAVDDDLKGLTDGAPVAKGKAAAKK